MRNKSGYQHSIFSRNNDYFFKIYQMMNRRFHRIKAYYPHFCRKGTQRQRLCCSKYIGLQHQCCRARKKWTLLIPARAGGRTYTLYLILASVSPVYWNIFIPPCLGSFDYCNIKSYIKFVRHNPPISTRHTFWRWLRRLLILFRLLVYFERFYIPLPTSALCKLGTRVQQPYR